MTKIWMSIVLLISTFTTQAQHTCRSKAHIGFCYPLSTHGVYARDYANKFSVHALVGVSAAEEAFCVSGLSNIIYGSSKGFTVAGFSNHISTGAKGFVAAGFMNTIQLQTRGVQAAGVMNLSGSVRGTQLAGFANISKGNIRGFQGAGYTNIAHNVKGTQLSGYLNIADTVNTQLSGFLNIAKVSKVQLSGFMNIADSCDYPIGIINIIKKGEKSIGFTADANQTAMLTFRSGGKVLYGIVGLGYNFKNQYTNLAAVEAGIGAHFTISKLARFNIEASTTTFTDFRHDVFMTNSLRVLPALTFGKHVELFAGPSINSVNSDNYSGENISNRYIWSDKDWGMFNGVYISGYCGLNYRF